MKRPLRSSVSRQHKVQLAVALEIKDAPFFDKLVDNELFDV